MGKKVARKSILANWVRMYIRLACPTCKQLIEGGGYQYHISYLPEGSILGKSRILICEIVWSVGQAQTVGKMVQCHLSPSLSVSRKITGVKIIRIFK